MSFSLASVPLTSPLLNTPIPKAWHAEGLIEIGQQPVGIVMSKSVTLNPRAGNIKRPDGSTANFHYYSDEMSLNAVGLANDGLEAHIGYIETAAAQIDKPFMISVSGFSVAEYVAMVERLQTVDAVTFIELNLSCPNTDQRVFCDTPELVEKLLENVKDLRTKKLGVKVSPSADTDHIARLVQIFADHQVDFITCSNTLGNCFLYDQDGNPVLDVNNGFGGMAGRALKPYALATLIRYKNALKKVGANIDLIGSGGVTTGQDVADYLRAGASLVGVASQIMHEGVECLGRIDQEFEEFRK